MLENEIIKLYEDMLKFKDEYKREDLTDLDKVLLRDVLDIIKRQKANLDDKEETIQFADKEIKRLNAEIERLQEKIKSLYKELERIALMTAERDIKEKK